MPNPEPWLGRVRNRRVPLTAVLVLAGLVLGLWGPSPPADLLAPSASVRFWLPWLAMLLGVAVRMWGAGNLRKNQEITDTGIYRMVRHPLYLGSLLSFFAYFFTVGDVWAGLALFLVLVLLVYYPTILHEEAMLARRFPGGQLAEYHRRPRLLPNLLRLPEALRTDRFTFTRAAGNLGLRGLGFLVGLPLLLKLLLWLRDLV